MLSYQEKMKLFGKRFIRNNNKLRIILYNKQKKIKEYLISNRKIKIKIKKEIFNSIIDISGMFCNCESLFLSYDFSKSKKKK